MLNSNLQKELKVNLISSVARGLTLSLLVVASVSCSDKKKDNPVIGSNFNNPNIVYPNNNPLFVATVRLKNPALLSELIKDEKGNDVIDQDLKDRILEEQEKTVLELQKISSEIKVLYKYRLVLNAIAVEAPQEFADAISELDALEIKPDHFFPSPKYTVEDKKTIAENVKTEIEKTSVTYMDVDKVQEKLKVKDADGNLISVRGQGVNVGIIDSGIDYTHAMLGGSGSKSDYDNMNPNKPSTLFPNSKVVGGFDFVGAVYDPGSFFYEKRIPKPDTNPMDRSGHGTHVAATVSGVGDGVTTYDGPAPDANLYAYKVFGDLSGGTSDSVVIAALERAMDPNQDFNIDDKMDVLNLSLGSDYGLAHEHYSEAVKNTVLGGTVVVISAGNSGAVTSIVGSPGTAEEAITVAAGVDYMEHNYSFPSIKLLFEGAETELIERNEAIFSTPLVGLNNLKGELVPVGTLADGITDEQAASIAGKIALIDRGVIPFVQKFEYAKAAGALAVVIVNTDEEIFGMSGPEGYTIDLPGVSVIKSVGDKIKAKINAGEKVEVEFTTDEVLYKPELIGSMGGFSSQGPREFDALIKPEITAPGVAIMSAKVGSGNEGVRLQGTSMAAPHVAGVAALLVQYRPELNAKDIKSIMLSSATLMTDESGDGERYPVSRQGAGMINAYRAAQMGVVFSKPTLSLGKLSIAEKTRLTKWISVTNKTNHNVVYVLETKEHTDKEMQITPSVSAVGLAPGEKTVVRIAIYIEPSSEQQSEIDGNIRLYQNGEAVGQIPVLAVVSRTTKINSTELVVDADTKEAAVGARAHLTLANEGLHEGEALVFNLLGKDPKKEPSKKDKLKGVVCDLESVGYRIIEKQDESGALQEHLQMAFKVYRPVSVWETCGVFSEIDLNGDGVSEIDVNVMISKYNSGFRENDQLANLGLKAAVLDTVKTRQIDKAHELNRKLNAETEKDYVPALMGIFDVVGYQQSSIIYYDVPKALFAGKDKIRIQSHTYSFSDRVVDQIDYLGQSDGANWYDVSLNKKEHTVYDMPESVALAVGSKTSVDMIKGSDFKSKVVVYYPRNKFNLSLKGVDEQSQILKPKFESRVVVP
jgi:subtilisin family serine protease